MLAVPKPKPTARPAAASGPPASGVSASGERRERGDTADPMRSYITIEEDAIEEDQPRTASSQRKDDRATGGEPKTFKPSGLKPTRREGRPSLNDEL